MGEEEEKAQAGGADAASINEAHSAHFLSTLAQPPASAPISTTTTMGREGNTSSDALDAQGEAAAESSATGNNASTIVKNYYSFLQEAQEKEEGEVDPQKGEAILLSEIEKFRMRQMERDR